MVESNMADYLMHNYYAKPIYSCDKVDNINSLSPKEFGEKVVSRNRNRNHKKRK